MLLKKNDWLGDNNDMIKKTLNDLIQWLPLVLIVGTLTGTASAAFLAGLEGVTRMREHNPLLLWLLPLGGAFVSFIYYKYGKDSAKGNNLLLERVYDQTQGQENKVIPLRMAPLVLLGTLATHLFGGSAGREGTAVQMGGSLSEWTGKLFKLDEYDRKLLLLCGISSGFGSVFGTPLAGAIFALELVAFGFLSYRAILPCLLASYIGHYVTITWGIHHSSYSLGALPSITAVLLLKITIASILFGMTALLFSTMMHKMKAMFTKWLPNPMVKSFVGGCLIIALVYLAGTRDYIGLSLPLMEQSFDEGASPFAFLLKTLFTTITLAAGFQGGEVTPLFVIGSTLGSALASLLSVSVPLLAGIGLIAVFSGATNTPIASFVLGIELFGLQGPAVLYMLIGCVIAYLCSGRTGIYSSQLVRGTIRGRIRRK